MTRTCGFRRCKQPFEPVLGQEETQKYCSPECGNSERVQRWNDRHKSKPNGGGPGGKRQPMLFSRSELHRRKPAKAALVPKPKTGDLFPQHGHDLHVTFGGAVECAGDGAVSDNTGSDYSKYSVKSATLPTQARPEAPIAA